MNKIENTWRLVPTDAAQNELAEVRGALGFLPQGYAAMAGLERLADLLAASEPSTLTRASATEHGEPVNVTVNHDPRGVSVGVWQGSHCIYSGAHPLPAATGVPTVEGGGAQKEAVMDAIADALGDAYDCMRVWAAWGVGTMRQDDFRLVADDAGRLGEIADAAIAAMRPAPAADDARDVVDVDWQLMRETAMLVRDRFSAALSIAYASSDATRSAIRRAHETYEALLAMLDAAIAAQRKGDA
jgi:hypothetical protein